MKLLSITVLYNPDKSTLENIHLYIDDVDHLMIWDNTPSSGNDVKISSWFKELFSSEELKKISIHSNGVNNGLSFVYNKAIEYGIKNKFTHLLTMDQDSKWENFHKFKDYCKNKFNKLDLAIIGPSINEPYSEFYEKEVPNLINSGTIVPIDVYRQIGNYCERFLLDAIDTEFCYRAHRNNIPVLVVNGHGSLHQSFGNPQYFKFRGRTWYCTNYSPFRLKGIIRNHVLVARIYPEQYDTRYRLKNVYLKQYTIAIILKEKQKFRKLFTIYKNLLIGLLTKKSLDSKYSKA